MCKMFNGGKYMNSFKCWGYRIDARFGEYFASELNKGILRQGWGYLEEQNLNNLNLDKASFNNLKIKDSVKKGDLLLIPRIPTWNKVTIARATEDWDKGYRFEIPKDFGDYGHMFPAEYVTEFVRDASVVSGDIRRTLKARNRFWNISHLVEDIEKIVVSEKNEKTTSMRKEIKFYNSLEHSFDEIFNKENFTEIIFQKLVKNFVNEEWEVAIATAINTLYPDIEVYNVGGKEEGDHGTDILVLIPSLIGEYKYAIAIQIKDYENTFTDIQIKEVAEQLSKADDYWQTKGYELIDKIAIITNVNKAPFVHIVPNGLNVKFYFNNDLKELLYKAGQKHIGFNVNREL